MEKTILALGGDGIGPEIVGYGLQVAEVLAQRYGIALCVRHGLLHGAIPPTDVLTRLAQNLRVRQH